MSAQGTQVGNGLEEREQERGEAAPAEPARRARAGRSRRRERRTTSLFAHGEPMIWLTGGALVTALTMIAALLVAVIVLGATTFWPRSLQRYELDGGGVALGEVTREEAYELDPVVLAELSDEDRAVVRDQDGLARRFLLRVGNKDLTGVTYRWFDVRAVADVTRPEWALCLERQAWGRFFGTPTSFLVDGVVVAERPADAWARFQELHPEARARHHRVRLLEEGAVGDVNHDLDVARRRLRAVELAGGRDSEAWRGEERRYLALEEQLNQEFRSIQDEIAELRRENDRYQLIVTTAEGVEQPIALADVVRAYPANQLGFLQKVGIYLSRWWEFLTAEPRDSNNEGGVYPAIVGTVVMTLLMSVIVVPFGVLAALYLREYARQGKIISLVRIAVNNLAGVPSIVFGVFGLGFFCYIVGVNVDELFFETKLPNPTFGKSGVLWASLTLALLTLPVVIVATEEALSAVPNSMREGSYACGATKWQTIQRIVLPRAAPGIMTGMILAIARGAGEVAPLMLVGAVKLAPELPLDLDWPFLHAERSFMHLGFHIYDLGFQSVDSEAAKPMVYTTTLLLIAIVVALNLIAIWIRARLRRKFRVTYI